ncbi:6510_t:CDS:2, partial [Scutellospora calospora]
SAFAVNNTSILLEKREVCANPGCHGLIFKDCSYRELYTKINAIDASDHKALSDALASMFAPDIDNKVTSENQDNELTQAWYSANSAIFKSNSQCVKEFMLTWICEKYIQKSSLDSLNELLNKLPSIFAKALPGGSTGSITAWVVKQALKQAMKKDVSITQKLINSAANIVEMGDVTFLYNVGNC